MNNQSLFSRIKKLVATERRIGIQILECLYEIERRKAYAELKYDGLFTYCVKELEFSDSQAYQRIQAMRALKEIPELKPMIQSGSLSISSVSKVQTHLRKERKAGKRIGVTQKLDLFRLMQNHTSKEVDAKLSEIRGEEIKAKLVLELDEEGAALWKQVKDLSAHKTGGSELDAFKRIAREWLKKNHPGRGVLPRRAVPLLTKVKPQKQPCSQQPAPEIPKATSRYIPAQLKKEIWIKSQSKCENCGGSHALEIDHIRPFAQGGGNHASNLRLLCRSCNRFMGINEFGTEKMKRM